MKNMSSLYFWLQSKAAQDRGAGLAEYALLLFLVAVAVIGLLTALGTRIGEVYAEVTAALGN